MSDGPSLTERARRAAEEARRVLAETQRLLATSKDIQQWSARVQGRSVGNRGTRLPFTQHSNRLLALLPSREFQHVAPLFEGVHFEPGQVLHFARVPIQHVYFPMSGIVSAAVVLQDGGAIEVAAIGNEGMVVVNAEHEILHLSEQAGAYLRLMGGEPTTNLLRLVHPALRIELRTTLFRAAETNLPAVAFDVPAEIEGKSSLVHLRVAPAAEIAPGCLLVTFERGAASGERAAVDAPAAAAAPDAVTRHLERELEQVKSNLRDTVEQYEASTEELKASNEELQAMNEELRSATEELETSREELQSINEELTTVNQEMKAKVEEVAQANSDLQNLMASTSIATVFLDRELSIMRFTPTAAGIFNLIPGDIGRPLAHLKHRLEYADLIADAATVLRTLVPMEREVRDDGRWYIARLQPYRTLEDHIAGVVLTLVDVTERNRATEALRLSEDRMQILIASAKDYAIFTTDRERQIDSWNAGAATMFGYDEGEMVGQSADLLFTPEDRDQGDAEREMTLALEAGRAENERWHARKDGSLFYGSGSVMPLRTKTGELRGFVKIIRNLTENQRIQEALHEHLGDLTRSNAVGVGREARMVELKREINALCARLGEPARYSPEAAD